MTSERSSAWREENESSCTEGKVKDVARVTVAFNLRECRWGLIEGGKSKRERRGGGKRREKGIGRVKGK